MEASTVSGAHTYKSLCVAAKHEEHRLEELQKIQQYQKPSGTEGNTKNHPLKKPPSEKQQPPPEKSTPRGGIKCYKCNRPGHFA
jgi:hypothetical protein